MISLRAAAAAAAVFLVPAAAVSAGTVHFAPPRAAVSQAVAPTRAVAPHVMLPYGRYPAVGPFVAALAYHGGPILTPPKVYVVFWGWTSDPKNVRPYMTKFLKGLGGSAWANTVTQYSGKGQGFIANPTGQLAGTWNDTSTIPSSPTDAQVQAEASKAATHFGGAQANAAYVVATATGHNTAGFGTQFCAYHGYAGGISYTNEPYMTDAGASCGANILGHERDGVSIVLGHEYAESETDPELNAWWDTANGEEIGDLCAWTGLGMITLSTGNFAVQPLWSNAANGCAL